jgi:perosamine synthetase
MEYIYPVYQPSLKGNEIKYLTECIETNWLTEKGRFVEAFEKEFAAFTGAKYATCVANGTLALHLALLALGIGQGDEVIVPTLTYIASVNAITYTGAIPVFADSEADSWQICPDDIRKKITEKSKAIMPVHLYGHPCNMKEIMKIADEYELFVVEDCAESFGARFNDTHTGVFGNVGVFSFYGNKTITTGEGGMIITGDKTLLNRAIHFKGQGLAKWREYWHDVIGYNYRITNLSAAVGLAQMERAEELIAKKRTIAEWYLKKLLGLPLQTQKVSPGAFHSWWMFTILAEDNETREELRTFLKEKAIETRPIFYPVHTMPMYSQKYQKHKIAENIGWKGINLPSYPDLLEKDVDFICSCIRSFFE